MTTKLQSQRYAPANTQAKSVRLCKTLAFTMAAFGVFICLIGPLHVEERGRETTFLVCTS